MTANDLIHALMLKCRGVISLIGAGGKTTLMFTLADRLARDGKKVLTTTTTKILKPLPEQSPKLILSSSVQEILSQSKTFFKSGNHLTAGHNLVSPRGKVVGFDPSVIRDLWESALFDWIIVEADGADRKPLKICADHEPAVPDIATHVIALAGLSAIGKPLNDQWVFRAKYFSEVTALPPGKPVTESAMAMALAHDLKKASEKQKAILKIVFLNQADHPEMERMGRRIAECLERPGKNGDLLPAQRVVVGSLKRSPPVHRWYAPPPTSKALCQP